MHFYLVSVIRIKSKPNFAQTRLIFLNESFSLTIFTKDIFDLSWSRSTGSKDINDGFILTVTAVQWPGIHVINYT